jgi:prevent-host-death family protein
VKSVTAAQASERFDAMLDEVQREPVLIREQDRDVAVVISVEQYERLRTGALHAFLDMRNDVAREAADRGLNEQHLQKLLDEE